MLFGIKKKTNPGKHIGMRFEEIRRNLIHIFKRKRRRRRRKQHKNNQICAILVYTDNVSFSAFNGSDVIFSFAITRSSVRMSVIC